MEERSAFDINRLVPTYFKMALPVVFSMVITLIYNLADTYFIARTNDAMLVAGVSLCAPLFTALMAIGNIYGQGGSSLIARLLGNKDTESIKRVSAFCFYLSMATGVVIAVFLRAFSLPVLKLLGVSEQTIDPAMQYYAVIVMGAPLLILSFIHTNLMRSEGMATTSMICTVSGSILNIILDPIFISVLGWGAWGAAFATILGYTLTDILCLFFVLRKSKVLSVNISNSHVQGNELSQILGVGITAAITNIASSVCMILMNQFLKGYGDEKIAALGIVMKIAMIVQLMLVGFSFGGVPLFGFLYGAGEKKKLKELLRFCTIFLCGLALVESLIVFLTAKPFMRVFIDTESIIEDGAVMLRWQIAGMVFCAIVLLYTCLFQSSGKALQALAMSLSRQGLLFVAVFLIITAVAGYQGFLVAQPLADALSAALALVLYRLAFKK
ncbi:MAG: MATE family efflux transporter [Lachnospiraceae bacterium]|nr:MATE family efflux transporter [Lachnospiraceae bacterium]